MQWCISVFIGDEFGGSQRFACIFRMEIRHIQLMRLNSERSVLDCEEFVPLDKLWASKRKFEINFYIDLRLMYAK